MCWELVSQAFLTILDLFYEAAKGELSGEVIVLVGLSQGHSDHCFLVPVHRLSLSG